MSYWLDFDFNKTVRDFEYTRRAVVQMDRIITSSDFEEMDADMIFDYLVNQMETVLFSDYLKRYIYEKLEMEVPFRDVTLSEYQEIISNAFSDNHAPYSFTPTATRKTATIKRWLTQSGTSRNTIFELGFGLRMKAEEVSEFLTKVLKEEDFDFEDPTETVFWYAYKNDLPYAAADRLLKEYESMPVGIFSQKKWDAMHGAPDIYLLSEKNLLQYLAMLKVRGTGEEKESASFSEFMALYRKCCKIISEMNDGELILVDQNKIRTPDMIQPYHLEKLLCRGIPITDKYNLKPMTASQLGNLFQNKRMSRQRISGILSRKHPVERFDLITLLFFIYAQTVEPDYPAERYYRYIDDVNDILARCHMQGIYPVNPYEAFVLMCIVADYPLEVYAEVWEKSFQD